MMDMAGNLFAEFQSSHRSDWEKLVVKEIMRPISELPHFHPFYPHLCSPYFSHEEYDPARYALLQKCQRKDTGWLNMPALRIKDITDTTRKIEQKLTSGAQAILLIAQNNSIDQIKNILSIFKPKKIPFFISSDYNAVDLYKTFENNMTGLKGGIAHDPLAYWIRSGNEFDHSLSALTHVCNLAKENQDFYPLMIDGHVYHQAGVTPEQELAMVMASFTFYLDKLTDSGLTAQTISNHLFFSLSVGTDYLSEIAKLRAFRMLHHRLMKAYHCASSEINDPFIHAETSRLYHAETMEHTNIIRTTSEAMSAIIGGCNALTVFPFDNGSDFSERIALNISSIIAHESGVGQIPDPSAGSYFIENRSLMIAESAWNLFLEIERQGGICQSFKNGLIPDLVTLSWNAKMKAMKEGCVMVGVNQYNTTSKPVIHTEVKDSPASELLASENLPLSWYTN